MKIKTDLRDKLYYNKFKYRIDFNIIGANYIKWAKDIYDFIRLAQNTSSYRTLDPIELTDRYVDQVNIIINWYKDNKEHISMRTDYTSCAFFSNDLVLLSELGGKIDYHVTYGQAEILGEPDVIYLKNPKHNYRIYFRERNVTEDFRTEFKEFLDRYNKTLFPCPSLQRWVSMDITKKTSYSHWRHKWLQPHFFIEYDSESTLTIVKLIFDKYLGKIYKLEYR